MSKETVTLHYDGPALAGHQMDVAYLAPALYALNDLCKIANTVANGDHASVRVYANVDREQNSFVFDIEIVTSLIEQARALISDPRVQDAKEIAEWIGLIKHGAVAGSVGLLGLLKLLHGRPAEFEPTEGQDGRDMFVVRTEGDNNHITVITPGVKNLYEDRDARRSAKRILKPLEDEGYERLEFLSGGEVTESFDREEALEVLKMPDSPPGSENEEPQELVAWITVHSPILRRDARTWRFIYNGLVTSMDISETNIVAEALERGVNFGDSYRVKLEITQMEREPGNFTAKYKIKEVLDFRQGYGDAQETLEGL